MYEANCYNVMIVSPSDVSTEREIAKNVLYRWNELNSRFKNIVFSVLGYDINAHPDSGNHPQESLNYQLLEHADIIIAVFWTKLGTPTKEYSSGSVEEISKHINQGKKAYIYFSNKPVELNNVDNTQYEKLKEYKISIQGNSYFREFSTEESFKQQLFDDILLIANELEQTMKKHVDQTQAQEIVLSECEKSLLPIIMAKDGELKITSQQNFGTWFNSLFKFNKREIAKIEEAVENLENIGVIKSISSNEYKLTAKGYRLYDELFKNQ